MTKHSPFCYMKPGPGFLDHLAWARGPGSKSLGSIAYRARTYVLPLALPGLSWHWMVLLRPWANGSCYCAQSLQLCRRIMDRGPRITGAAPRIMGLSCGVAKSLGGVDATSIHAAISSLTVPPLSPSGVNY
jgi:hypothetical protein